MSIRDELAGLYVFFLVHYLSHRMLVHVHPWGTQRHREDNRLPAAVQPDREGSTRTHFEYISASSMWLLGGSAAHSASAQVLTPSKLRLDQPPFTKLDSHAPRTLVAFGDILGLG